VADSDHPKQPPAPRKPRDLRSLHSELGPAWDPPEQPRRSRSRPNTSSEGLLASNHSTFGSEVKTFKRPDIAPTNTPLYPGAWPPSAEKLAETKFMPPKQHRQPEVGEDPASMPPAQHRQPAATGGPAHADTTQQHPEWMAYLLGQLKLEIDNAIESKVVPRLDALEGNTKSRPASPEPEYVQSPTPQSYATPSQTPQSYAPQSAGSVDFQQQQRQPDGTYNWKEHRKPRFRPESLPHVRYGDDIASWLADMDHVVMQHGEEVVCPEIFSNCFQSGDAIKVWYMGMGSHVIEAFTSGSGCWGRFRKLMEKHFMADISLRQLAAEDRAQLPGEAYAAFALQKVGLIRNAFPHLAQGAMIAMVKRKLDWDAAAFCREKESVDNFVSELMDYDNLRAMQPARRQLQAPRSGQQVAPAQAFGPPRRQAVPYQQQPANAPPTTTGSAAAYADPRLPTIQLRKNPQTGADALSYLDRFGKTVFLQRPCGHCESAGVKNAWHFEFSCANKTQGLRRPRTYVGAAGLPGTFESPSGLPTSYTFSGQAVDPDPEENPFSIDDVDNESGNGDWGQ
jgi:hypothetical protein